MDYEITNAVSADFLLKTLANGMFRGAKLIGKISETVYRKKRQARAVSANISGITLILSTLF